MSFRNILLILLGITVILSLSLGYQRWIDRAGLHIEHFLETILNEKCYINKLKLDLPLRLELDGIGIGDYAFIERAYIYPRLSISFFKKQPIIFTLKILNPKVRLTGTDSKWYPDIHFLDTAKPFMFENGLASVFNITDIYIINGSLIYDLGSGRLLEFMDIKGDIRNFDAYLYKKSPLYFSATSSLKNYNTDVSATIGLDGTMALNGEIDAFLRLRDVSIFTLGNFFSKYLEGLIKNGKVDIDSKIRFSKNFLVADCNLESRDLKLEKEIDKNIGTPIVASFLLLVNFEKNLVKIKALKGNFLKVLGIR